MKPQDIIKAIAKLDGWTRKPEFDYLAQLPTWDPRKILEQWEKDGSLTDKLPPYLTSRDAIVPVIEKQDYGTQLRFIRELAKIVIADRWHERENYAMQLLKATPFQLCEALLRATNKWIE
jgi:hypothetical protein